MYTQNNKLKTQILLFIETEFQFQLFYERKVFKRNFSHEKC